MVLSLEDVNGKVSQPALDLDDVNSPSVAPSAMNDETANLLSAQVSELSDSDQYSTVHNELTRTGNSFTLDDLVSSWDANEHEQTGTILKDIIADPELTDEQKQSILGQFGQHQLNDNIYTRVSTQMLMSESEGETAEEEDIRMTTVDFLREIDEYNYNVQQAINATVNSMDTNLVNGVGTFVESLLPFADAGFYARFTQEEGFRDLLNGNSTADWTKAMTLLGESKEDIRKAINAVPIEKRFEVVQPLIEVVKSYKGSFFNMENAGAVQRALEDLLLPSNYNDGDRMADNLFSILDATVLFAPLRGVASLTRGLDDLPDAARRLNIETGLTDDVVDTATNVADEEQLLLEFKPAPVSYVDEVDQVIDNMPVEATSAEIRDFREVVGNAVSNPNAATVDDIINNSTVVDRMTSNQITEFRKNLEPIIQKRSNELRQAEFQTRVARSGVQPSSVSQIAKDTNPSKARAIHNATVQDTSDVSARRNYGTTRTDAISNDVLPEIGTSSGSVRNKVSIVEESNPRPRSDILRHVRESQGRLDLKASEKAELAGKATKDWKNLIGFNTRVEMSTIKTGDAGVQFDMVYGNKNSGFSNGETAKEGVQLALAKYGITDENVELLKKRKNGEYTPTVEGDDITKGDFLVRVKHHYNYDIGSVENIQNFENSPIFSKVGILGKILPLEGTGGVLEHAIPKSAIIDADLFKAGTVAGDKVAGVRRELISIAKNISKQLKKASPEQVEMFRNYVKKANEENIPFNSLNLASEGFHKGTIQALRDWKELHDTIWAFTNRDLNSQLNARGFEVFVHKASDTKLITVRESKSSAWESGRVYYASTEDGFKPVNITRQEINDLYEKGGSIQRLRTPEEFGDEVVEYVVNQQTVGGGYTRKFNVDEPTLAYRHGYYHVKYTNPYYITKTITGKGGKKYTKTIARANSLKDVKVEVDRLNQSSKGEEFGWKVDRNRSQSENFDDELDVMFNSGGSSQRFRGERLRMVGSENSMSDMTLETPAEALSRSINNASTKVAFRDVIDTSKRRFMNQFRHLLQDPSKYPTDLKQFKPTADISEVGDAISTWRWVNALENGYTDIIDDSMKAFLNTIGDISSEKGWKHMDKLAKKGAEGSLSAQGRRAVFTMFLGLNPIGQLILQFAPAMVITGTLNPGFWLRGGIPQFLFLRQVQRGINQNLAAKTIVKNSGIKGDDVKFYTNLAKYYRNSGISSGVSVNNFRQDDLKYLADMTFMQKVGTTINKPFNLSRKVGFDTGEQSMIDIVWLSEIDKAMKKKGSVDLTSAELDEVVAKTRALTGDMNKGGEMPYNSNSLSTILQFFGAVHKMTLGLFTHKNLTLREKLSLNASYMLTFGVGYTQAQDFLINNLNIQDPTVIETIRGGTGTVIFNKVFSEITGEESAVAVGPRLNPISIDALADFTGSLLTGNIPEAFLNSPVGGLFKDNGRLNEFAKAVVAPFIPGSYEDINEWKQVAMSFAQLSSGASNMFKAQYMLEARKLVSNSGDIVDEDVSFMDALMKGMGFQTWDEIEYWSSRTKYYEATDKLYSDVDKHIDDVMRVYTREGITIDEIEGYAKVLGEFGRIYANDPRMMDIVSDRLAAKVRRNGDDYLNKLYKLAGLVSREDFMNIVNSLPDEEDKQRLIEWVDQVERLK